MLGFIPGQDLSTILIELVNIQSRSLEMMATSQRSQQEAFQELTRVSRDKSNDSMFTAIKTFDGTNRQIFEDWIDMKLTRLVEPATEDSGPNCSRNQQEL